MQALSIREELKAQPFAIPTGVLLATAAAVAIALTVLLVLKFPVLALAIFATVAVGLITAGMNMMGIAWLVCPVLAFMALIVTVGGLTVLKFTRRGAHAAADRSAAEC